MRSIVVDTGPLVALFDPDDHHHVRIENWLKQAPPGTLLDTVPAVITEAMYLLDFSPDRQIELLEWVASGGLRLRNPEPAEHRNLAALMKKYRSLPMDFADAGVVWLAATLGTSDVLTIDRKDFELYRAGKGKRFRLLPD